MSTTNAVITVAISITIMTTEFRSELSKMMKIRQAFWRFHEKRLEEKYIIRYKEYCVAVEVLKQELKLVSRRT